MCRSRPLQKRQWELVLCSQITHPTKLISKKSIQYCSSTVYGYPVLSNWGMGIFQYRMKIKERRSYTFNFIKLDVWKLSIAETKQRIAHQDSASSDVYMIAHRIIRWQIKVHICFFNKTPLCDLVKQGTFILSISMGYLCFSLE